MSNWLLLSALIVLIIATYLSALHLALLDFSRSALQKRLERKGKAESGEKLAARIDEAILSISLLRTFARVGFFVLVIAMFVEIGELVIINWGSLVLAGLITVALLWVFSSVLAYALAKHANIGLISTGIGFVRIIALLGRPLIKVVFFIDEAIRRLSGANLIKDEEQAEEELLLSIEDTQREGGLDVTSAALMESVVEFSGTDVGEVMTPRTDIEGIELTNDLAKIRAFIVQVGHSRIPVFADDLDHIKGILYIKDLVPYLGEDATDFKLEPILRQPIFIPETKLVSELLRDFQQNEVHMGIVIDEYGGTAGLVTIEDVLEELVGEIHDEHEPDSEDDPQLVSIDDTHAEADGRFHIDDLNERLGLDVPEDDDFDTIGGFMLARLGHVPKNGEIVEAYNAKFTTITATRTHIQRVAIELINDGSSLNGKRNGNGNGK